MPGIFGVAKDYSRDEDPKKEKKEENLGESKKGRLIALKIKTVD
jgi:hypothetical protein